MSQNSGNGNMNVTYTANALHARNSTQILPQVDMKARQWEAKAAPLARDLLARQPKK